MVECTNVELAGWIQFGLDRGVLWAIGLRHTPVACGVCDVVLGTVGGSGLQVRRNGFPLLCVCVGSPLWTMEGIIMATI